MTNLVVTINGGTVLPNAPAEDCPAIYYTVDKNKPGYIFGAVDNRRIKVSRIESFSIDDLGNLNLEMMGGGYCILPPIIPVTEKTIEDDRANFKAEMESMTLQRNSNTLSRYASCLMHPYRVWFDELRERMYTNYVVNLAETNRKREYPLDDAATEALINHMQSNIHIIGSTVSANVPKKYREPSWSRDDYYSAILLAAQSNHVNPFRVFLDKTEWDGVSRLGTMWQDFLGATNDPKYLEAVAKAWLVGAVARQYVVTPHEVIPTIIGLQGVGKTSFFSRLGTVDGEHWHRSTSVDMKHTAIFLDGVRGNIIVELGEGASIRKDVETVKEFLSRASDCYRKPYARHETVCNRHFVIALTSNKREIVSDQTGARRFYPINCDATKRKYDPRPVPTPQLQHYIEQIWAEAKHLYDEGCPIIVSADAEDIATKEQSAIIRDEPNIDAINTWLDDPDSPTSKVGCRTTRQDILYGVFGVVPGATVPLEYKEAYAQWRSITPNWEPRNTTVRRNGKPTKGVMERIKESAPPVMDDESKVFSPVSDN